MVGSKNLSLETVVRPHSPHPLVHKLLQGFVNITKGVIFQTAVTVSSVVTDVGSFFTGALSWMGDAVDFVMEHPLVFIMVGGMAIAGFAIGGLRRLIRL